MNSRKFRGWLKDLLILSGVLGICAATALLVVRSAENGQPKRKAFARRIETMTADAVRSAFQESLIIEDPAVLKLTNDIQMRLESGLEILSPESPPVRVLVFRSYTANALAFPGNLIVIYSGLIDRLNGPEELAAVLAHEMSHCIHNDSENVLIRELGISIVLGSSGRMNDIFRGAVRLNYGRRAENRADRYAVDLLAASDIDPAAFARALDSLKTDNDSPDWLKYIDTHMPPDERVRIAQSRAQSLSGDFLPVDTDWNAAIAALSGNR